jgi:hypothetical protein
MLRIILLIVAAVGGILVAVNFLHHRDVRIQRRDEPYAPPKLESPQRRDLR